jgi:HAD superfamily hydrolase (TIGR01484 family)
LKTKNVVFADLDGTFLDEAYGCKDTKPLVKRLSALGSAVVFCSSKTRSEIEYYRKTLRLNEPFISENGSAIFIPKNYFNQSYRCTRSSGYNVITLGASYCTLR